VIVDSPPCSASPNLCRWPRVVDGVVVIVNGRPDQPPSGGEPAGELAAHQSERDWSGLNDVSEDMSDRY